MEKNFDFIPLPELKEQELAQPIKVISPVKTIRLHVDVPFEIAEKVRDHVYARTKDTQNNLILHAIQEFLERNPVESRPETEKSKNRAGRKRKLKL
ncbi:MAG: hypothetical protein BGO68_02190 [Candidatus Amoebophilus sp. 36-38]|nr:MAG: hypothetical protein BGO68_02190 [Candidatus Amoebophilus sp. 36-38]